MNRIDVVKRAVAATSARSYLEIGVKDGECFHAVDAATRVAVDPRFTFRPPLAARLRRLVRARTGTQYFPVTSDRFFRQDARRFASFDVVFVDGLHTYEQSYRDVENALAVLADGGVVLVHDSNPHGAAAAAPTLEEAGRTAGYGGEWSGDVYKAIVRLRCRSDVRVTVLDCDQGVAVVTRGRPDERLELTPGTIDRLDYEAFAARRAELLRLVPADQIDRVLRDSRR